MNDVTTCNLIVIGTFLYPKGSGPTNRIHLYCKAFKEKGGNPLVLCLDAPFQTQQSFRYIGRYDGIPFCYTRKSYIRKNNFIKRNIQRIYGLFNSLYVFNKYRKRDQNTVVLYYAVLTADEFFLTLFLKLAGIKILRDYSEAPLYILKEKRFPLLQRFLLKNIKLKTYNSLIVISDFLKDFFSEMYPAHKIFQIPIMVDLNRFNIQSVNEKSDKRLITYIGALGSNKDGLDILIESFSRVKKYHDNVHLNIACHGPEYELKKLREMISDSGLIKSVSIRVSLDNNEIPVLLRKSEFLVLSRPDNSKAKAGFPTKLGEYLASKKPVVITKTGEIPKYLEDNKSAYLAEPGDINDFTDKLLFALNDPGSANIGLEGFRVAEKYFDYIIYGNYMIEICNKLYGKNDSLNAT